MPSKTRKVVARIFWRIGHGIARLGCILNKGHVAQEDLRISKYYCVMCAKDKKATYPYRVRKPHEKPKKKEGNNGK